MCHYNHGNKDRQVTGSLLQCAHQTLMLIGPLKTPWMHNQRMCLKGVTERLCKHCLEWAGYIFA